MPDDYYMQLMQRDEAHRKKRNELNTQNTEMLHQQVVLDEDYKTAIRNGDDKAADKIRDELEQLKTDIEYHGKKMLALQGTMRDDPDAVRLCKGLHGVTREKMQKINENWQNQKTDINATINTLYEQVEALGEIAGRGDVIYNRLQHAVELTGLNLPYIQNRANVDVNTARKIGVIYPDVKAIEAAFNKGRAKR
jgi:hypothetical protein